MNADFLLGKLSPFQNKKTVITDNQSTNDIIDSMLAAHKKYVNEYDKISSYFWNGSPRATAQKIFSYLKKNVRYNIEPDYNQSVKSPSAILSTAKVNGYNDCKHYALFSGGILDGLNRKGHNINWAYRFANYKTGSRIPHHTFIVLNPQTKNEIWLDPVLEKFDEKKPFVNKIDKKMLYNISGMEDFYGEIGRRSKSERRAKRKAKKQARRYGENCKGRTAAKIAPPLIAGRKAFLLLLRLNVKQLGKKIVLGLRNPEQRKKIIETWCKFGGKASQLKSTAAKVEAKLKRKGKIQGFLGVPIATLLAAALPIIKAMLKFLPQGAGTDVAEEIVEGAEGIVQTDDQGNDVSGLGYPYCY